MLLIRIELLNFNNILDTILGLHIGYNLQVSYYYSRPRSCLQ